MVLFFLTIKPKCFIACTVDWPSPKQPWHCHVLLAPPKAQAKPFSLMGRRGERPVTNKRFNIIIWCTLLGVNGKVVVPSLRLATLIYIILRSFLALLYLKWSYTSRASIELEEDTSYNTHTVKHHKLSQHWRIQLLTPLTTRPILRHHPISTMMFKDSIKGTMHSFAIGMIASITMLVLVTYMWIIASFYTFDTDTTLSGLERKLFIVVTSIVKALFDLIKRMALFPPRRTSPKHA